MLPPQRFISELECSSGVSALNKSDEILVTVHVQFAGFIKPIQERQFKHSCDHFNHIGLKHFQHYFPLDSARSFLLLIFSLFLSFFFLFLSQDYWLYNLLVPFVLPMDFKLVWHFL